MQTSKNRQDHRQSSGFDAPGLIGRSPVVQLRGIEPEVDFKCSGFRSIGAVDDIAANVDSQVTANGAGLGLEGLVAPISLRALAMTPSPPQTMATTGRM